MCVCVHLAVSSYYILCTYARVSYARRLDVLMHSLDEFMHILYKCNTLMVNGGGGISIWICGMYA